ncbi:SusC/RagA family TonB-linked outer membrane protein [Hymenobacter crusticola]|uniref:SusC/RagA family TonB-linked outer membrane protein n=1 Tax=Hymenobacter crusticola TaxID=1770526 RepID=A0A243WKA3_9BACT|nr:SusC/RagA family TonB-linked outer membrane protein [Hymenobacter crusticola]OUJ75534.1 SusC/RagA family TonB-linked outer membrane protein [Hymenobacter crusticola]
MKRLLLMSFLLMVTLLQQVAAQNRTVSGRVTDRQSNEGLPGVTVLLKGTTNGISTNSDGTYTLTVPAQGGTLVFSSIGFVTIERAIGTENQVNVSLGSDSKQLNEVVVTALGIEKDTRTLGYATQEIKGGEVAQKSEPNVLNALQGKVAGVNITGASGLAGASTNINIRGITSLGGNNQPLFVVDGIPISNDLNRTNGGPNGTLGGAQQSNRALDIDPETIASINILKGPAAAALYGSRASNGAIVITTKTGASATKKVEVTVTSGINFQRVLGLPDFQNDYGQGTSGVNTTTDGKGDIYTGQVTSWGPRFGTNPTRPNGLLLADNSLLPYRAYPNNIKDFFRTGRILTNGVNLAGNNGTSNFSLNVNNTDQKGITDESVLKRTSVQLSGGTTLQNKIKINGSVNFIQNNQTGPLQGNGGSAFGQLGAVPRSLDLEGLPYTNATGGDIFFVNRDNPNWILRNAPTSGNVTRFISIASVGYDFFPWLNVQYRAGLDSYDDRRKQSFAIGSTRVPLGQVYEDNYQYAEFTGDLLLNAKKDNIFVEGLNANLLLGQQVNQRRRNNQYVQANQLAFTGLYNASIAGNYNGSGETSSLRRLLGYYADLSLAYKDYLFLEGTARVDQSSTLPVKNNTFLYPSVNASFVFTDAFGIDSDIFSYGKIRGNVARVGRDADPYQLETYYVSGSQGNNVASVSFPFNGVVGFTPNTTIGGGTALKPEFTKSAEIGTNLGFFGNKLTFDVTYFKSVSSSQILAVTTPGSTGYLSRRTNAGRIDNKGWEVLVIANPVKAGSFSWDINANFTRLRNKVVEIAEGVERSSITGNAFTGTIPSYAKGYPYGVIVGNKKPTVTEGQYAGQYIINPLTGLWANELTSQIIADPNPDWQGGVTNTFTYKGIAFSFLIDAIYGGDIASFTQATYKANGMLKETGRDRELPHIIPGVIANGDGTYRPNNIQIDAQSYWSNQGTQSDLNVYDATHYTLREVSLSYSLPKALLARTPFGGASFTLSGRNLFYIAPNANFFPEVNTQGAGNIRGLDLQGSPSASSYGAYLRFTF